MDQRNINHPNFHSGRLTRVATMCLTYQIPLAIVAIASAILFCCFVGDISNINETVQRESIFWCSIGVVGFLFGLIVLFVCVILERVFLCFARYQHYCENHLEHY